MSDQLIKDKTLEESADGLTSFMPGGRPFLAARLPGTKLRGLLLGLGNELLRAESTLNEMVKEHDIRTTTNLIEEWERALGIPDCCFSGTGTIEERRLHVLTKLASMSVQTAQDFIDLAQLFGFVVEITPGADPGIFPFGSSIQSRENSVFALGFPSIFNYVDTDIVTSSFLPLRFFADPQTARFSQIVTMHVEGGLNTFALDFAIQFSAGLTNIIVCLFNRLKPANVELIFEFTDST